MTEGGWSSTTAGTHHTHQGHNTQRGYFVVLLLSTIHMYTKPATRPSLSARDCKLFARLVAAFRMVGDSARGVRLTSQRGSAVVARWSMEPYTASRTLLRFDTPPSKTTLSRQYRIDRGRKLADWTLLGWPVAYKGIQLLILDGVHDTIFWGQRTCSVGNAAETSN